MNVQITQESRRFVAEQVQSGRFATEDEVVEDALRRMRRQEGASPTDDALDRDPLWGMFRDEPELIDRIVVDAIRERQTVPPRASADE